MRSAQVRTPGGTRLSTISMKTTHWAGTSHAVQSPSSAPGHLSPFRYFRAVEVMEGRALSDLWDLVGISAVAAAIAFFTFANRDIKR